MADGMSAGDPGGTLAFRKTEELVDPQPLRRRAPITPVAYGTIVIVGGGCYGSYYLRQLGRARDAGALTWHELVVVDRDPGCRAARERSQRETIVTRDWKEFFADFLDAAALDPGPAASAAIVPSPLMPHLLFDWVVDRARARWPERLVSIRSLEHVPDVPWQRASPDGATYYVSFAEWMCPINCIEPARCPATRELRGWTMPTAITRHVSGERARGHVIEGPFVFHCTHRAYGVGMIDVSAIVDADRAIRELGEAGPAEVLVGTMSHCHGALGQLTIAPL